MKITFKVPDMECAHCAMHLQNLEDDLIGVKRIDASYKKMSMEVEFDEKKIDVAQIIKAANALGYHPELKPV